jgi:hypothetical protein
VSGQLHAPAALPQRAPDIRWTGDRVGPRAGPDTAVRRKTPALPPEPEPPIIQPAAERYTTVKLNIPSTYFLE